MKKSKIFIAGIVCCVVGVIGLFGLATNLNADLLSGSLALIAVGVALIWWDKKRSKSNQPYQPTSFNQQQSNYSYTPARPAPISNTKSYSPKITITTMDRDCNVTKDPGEYSQEKEFTVVGVMYEGRQDNLAMLCDTKIEDAELVWTTYKGEDGIKVYFEGLEMGWVSRENLPFFRKYDDKIRYISNAFVGMYHSGKYFARFRVRYYAPK